MQKIDLPTSAVREAGKMGSGAPNSDSILGLGPHKAYGCPSLHMFSSKPLGTEGI